MNGAFSKNSIGIQVLRVLAKQAGALPSETVADLMKLDGDDNRLRVRKACLNLVDSGYVVKKKVWLDEISTSRLTMVFAITAAGHDQVIVYPDPNAQPDEEPDDFVVKVVNIHDVTVELHPNAAPSVFDIGERSVNYGGFDRPEEQRSLGGQASARTTQSERVLAELGQVTAKGLGWVSKQTANALEQGHMDESARPQCANCWAHLAEKAECGLGEFATTSTSWCAVWIPTTEWAQKHERACHAMGLSGSALKNPHQTHTETVSATEGAINANHYR